jgi:protoporphyrinogen oxidase
MENIWRFFDNTHCIGGVVFARSEEEAIDNTKHYLVKHFTDITNEDILDVCVWKITYDDEYDKDFPYAVATNY